MLNMKPLRLLPFQCAVAMAMATAPLALQNATLSSFTFPPTSIESLLIPASPARNDSLQRRQSTDICPGTVCPEHYACYPGTGSCFLTDLDICVSQSMCPAGYSCTHQKDGFVVCILDGYIICGDGQCPTAYSKCTFVGNSYTCLYGGVYECDIDGSSEDYCALGQECNPDSTAGPLEGCQDPEGQICGCVFDPYNKEADCRSADQYQCCGDRYIDGFWCSSSQTCGASSCLDPDPLPTSTTFSTSVMNPSVTVSSTKSTSTTSPSTSTTTMSTTTSSTTSTTTMSTTTSSTSSTTAISTPTIVPGVGTFVYRSCLVDIWDARVLVADSDDSESMTVQRCVEVARSGYWRYAGVEFGTQCYVGNTIHGPNQFPDSDCAQACAGDSSQSCGEAGRIQVYEDLTWKNPTIDELIAAVERYNATMEDAREAIATYQGHVNQLDELLQSQPSRKRQAQQIEALKTAVTEDYNNLQAVSGREEIDREALDEALAHNIQRDTLPTANTPQPLPEDLFEQWGITGENLAGYLRQILDRISQWLDEFQHASEAGTPPQVDTAAAAAEVEVALQAIGTALAVTVVTGFFLVLHSIASFFKGLLSGGGGGSGGQTSTTTTVGPTTAISTTTTTSTCTATATTTPVAIFAASGASTDDFNALIDTLPDDPGSTTLTESWLPNYLYTGYVDGCSLEKLAQDPIVMSWLITQGSQSIWQFDREGTLSCPVLST